MLAVVGAPSLDALLDEVIPPAIRRRDPLPLPPAEREHDYLARLWTVASKNQVFRSFIGLGYYDTITPAVILRNVLREPGLVHALHARTRPRSPRAASSRSSTSRRW